MNDNKLNERICIRVTKRYVDLLDELVVKGVYKSRVDAIRDALTILYEYHKLDVKEMKTRKENF